jgi:Protein of unknown function (DUF2934)
MPRPKNPKKNNGAVEPALNADAAIAKADTKTVESTASPSALEGRNTEMKTTIRKTRTPEIVKAETRSNLVPINLEEEIRRLAYLLSERRGFEPGHETEDWLTAEREVNDRYHQHTA